MTGMMRRLHQGRRDPDEAEEAEDEAEDKLEDEAEDKIVGGDWGATPI